MPDETSATVLRAFAPLELAHRRRSVYRQILVTYLRRPAFWFVASFFLMGIGALLLAVLSERPLGAPPQEESLPDFAFPYYFALVITHLKLQLTSSRSALVPGYRAAHIAVAGVLVAPIFTLLPAMASLALHAPLISPAGFIFAFFSLAGWGLYLDNVVLFTAAFLVWFSFMFSPLRPFYFDLLAGEYPTLAVLLFAGGVLAFVALVRRMLGLSEDKAEYFKNIDFSSRAALPPRGGAAVNPPLAEAYGKRWLAWICAPAEEDIRLPRAAHLTVWGFLIRRRALEGGQNIFTALVILLPLGILLVLLQGGNPWQPKSIGHFLLPWQGLVLPAFILLIGMSKRGPHLGREMLLPLTRGQFLLAHGLLLARDVAFLWLFTATSLIVALALFDMACLRDPAFWLGLLVAAFTEVLASALMLWVSRTHAFVVGGIVFALFLFAVLPGGMLTAKVALALSPIGLLLVLLCELALAGAILADAARRWMRTDLA